ncbi:aldo/keto reductase [Salinicoccus sp. CNSTN-B1]
MRQLNLKDGLNISEFSLGCMNLPLDDKNEMEKIIQFALESGITHFDTADLYQFGKNEQELGKVLNAFRSTYDFTIATKGGNEFDQKTQEKVGWNPTPKHIKSAIKDSMHRLGVDHIDLYQLHGGTIEDNKDETISAFDDLKQEGVITSYGISSIRLNVIDYYLRHSDMSTIMMQFNPLDNRPLEVATTLKEDVTILARGPVMKGALSSSWRSVIEEKFPDGFLDYSYEDLKESLERLSEVDEDLTALSYAFLKYNEAAIVNGVSSLKQLESNIESYNKMPDLSQEEYKAVLDAVKIIKYEEHRA